MDVLLYQQTLPTTMLLFKRILEATTGSRSRDKRRAQRYVVSPAFPLRAVLSLCGRDTFGNPLKASDNKGWDWKGHLVNFSSTGARVELPPAALAARGDECNLKLSIDGYQLVIPSRVAHLKEHRDHVVFGLELNLTESETRLAYRQLIDLVTLGASLKCTQEAQLDPSGYLVEHYGEGEEATLKVWREAHQHLIAAFELRVRQYYFRGTAKSRKLNFFYGENVESLKSVPVNRHNELQRLFDWLTPNLAKDVPADVVAFLKHHARV